MGLIYGVTWYSMSLAMPGLFSMNAILKNQSEESERTIANLSFWLKYWVVFAYYFVLEFVLDCFISWVPFYSELKLLCLIMASPITPFVGVKAFMGMPIEQLEINRSPVESIFHFITVFNQSSREGAHQIGLNRDALRQNLTFAGLQAGKGLQLAATGFNYLLTVLQNMQGMPRLPVASITEGESDPISSRSSHPTSSIFQIIPSSNGDQINPEPESSTVNPPVNRQTAKPQVQKKVKKQNSKSRRPQIVFEDSYSSEEIFPSTDSSSEDIPSPPRIKTRNSVKKRNSKKQ